ncbi:MAG: VWA domain-containing protein [Acidobacteria bacterium]|nr:VWA domain-containing protein [Acidobacteriota bacterium]
MAGRRNFTRKGVAALVLSALLCSPSHSQQNSQPVNPRQQPAAPTGRGQPPRQRKGQEKGTIRTVTDLVLIDAQVTDRGGKPVKGLKPEQFTLLEDDKPQKVSTFDYYDIEAIETAAAQDSTPVVVTLGAVAAPERVRQAVRDRRMIVLFFDMTALEPPELLRATDAAQRFLREQMTPADLVAAAAFGHQFKVIANFTNNRALLERAVARLVPGKESQLAATAEAAPAAGEEAVSEDTGSAFTADETEFNIFNNDRKLAAVEALANLLRDIPGKKSVIHFTSGITQTGGENRSQLRAATDAANRANVSFYTVDARGLLATVPGGDPGAGAAAGTAMFSGAAVFRQVQSRQESRETLATLAGDTGGRAFFDTGDFREVFQKVQADAAGYYLLGYYSANTKPDGRWRRVKVRVDAPGVRVRYREGYYAPKDYGRFTAEDRERQLEEAMRAETPRVELPIALETAQFRVGKDEIFVPIAAKLASSALQWAEKRGRREAEFDFAAEVREETSGRVAGALRDTVKVKLGAERFQQLQQRALVYQGGMILGPGRYRLKFLARENETGRIGTFEQEFVLAPPAQPERLELSSVLLSSQLETVRKPTEEGKEVEKKALAADAKMKTSPLEMGGERIIPSVTRVFTTQQKLYVFFQAYSPPNSDGANLRAGLVFFRNGERANATPLVEPAAVDAKARTAAFRISLPLEKLVPGRYTVQAVVVEAGGEQAAFARSYFALRQPPAAAAPTKPGQ